MFYKTWEHVGKMLGNSRNPAVFTISGSHKSHPVGNNQKFMDPLDPLDSTEIFHRGERHSHPHQSGRRCGDLGRPLLATSECLGLGVPCDPQEDRKVKRSGIGSGARRPVSVLVVHHKPDEGL